MPLRNSCRPSVVPSGPEIQRRLASGALLGRALDGQTRCRGRVDFLDQLDFGVVEEAM
jgi:hypothetical protein